MQLPLQHLTIVGVGLIGGSIGLAAKKRGTALRVHGVGRDAARLEAARKLGAIDECHLDLPSALRDAEVVIFCTPVSRIALQIQDAANLCPPGALLTDAGSTKRDLVQTVEANLPASARFVGGHPLAGSEKKGPEFADADLFVDRWTVLTPTEKTPVSAVEDARDFWQALGARVRLMSPEDHDRALALTSHLPHLIAASLAGILPENLRDLTATGFRDTTRVASGDRKSGRRSFSTIARPSCRRSCNSSIGSTNFARRSQAMRQRPLINSSLKAKRCAMLWEVEIFPKGHDGERARVAEEYDLLTHAGHGGMLQTKSGPIPLEPGLGAIEKTSRGFFVIGDLDRKQIEKLAGDLLVDAVVEEAKITGVDEQSSIDSGADTVLFKPGVMDPVAASVIQEARDLGIPVDSVHTFRRYYWSKKRFDVQVMFKVLRNDAIEHDVPEISQKDFGIGSGYVFRRNVLSIRELDDAGLMNLSKDGQLSLSLDEMKTIRSHFRDLGREPTDVELETIAQTWSEHCSHKTLKGIIECGDKRYQNLLKETIFGATQEIRKRLGNDDWCVSVFEDNAGVVKFDDNFHVCFKVETHNHPSAIEPYGARIPASAASFAIPWAPAWARSRSATQMSFASRRLTRRRSRCRSGCCIPRR